MRLSKTIRIAGVTSVLLLLITGIVVMYGAQQSARTSHAQDVRTRSLAAADQIATSSSLLTNTVRAFTATSDRTWLDQYWNEINVTKSQTKALAELKTLGTPQSELALIKQASDNSAQLVKLETRAMRLVLEASNAPAASMPTDVANWQLSAEDAALPTEKKLQLARSLVFGSDYQNEVSKIMAPLTQFRSALTQRVTAQAKNAEDARSATEAILAGNAILLALTLMGMLLFSHLQLGSVLQRYTTELKRRDPKDLTLQMKPSGVAELRELVTAFNTKNQ